MVDSAMGRHLHLNLLNRRETLGQQLKAIDNNIQEESLDPHDEFKQSMLKQKEEAMYDLAMVEEELKVFCDSSNQDGNTKTVALVQPNGVARNPPETRAPSHSFDSKFKSFVDRKAQKVKDLLRRHK